MGGAAGTGGALADAGPISPTFQWLKLTNLPDNQRAGDVGVRADRGVYSVFDDPNGSHIRLAEFNPTGGSGSPRSFTGAESGHQSAALDLSVGVTSQYPLIAGSFLVASPFQNGYKGQSNDGLLAVVKSSSVEVVYASGFSTERITGVTNTDATALDGVYFSGWSNSSDTSINGIPLASSSGGNSCLVAKQLSSSNWGSRITSTGPLLCNDIATTSTEIVVVGSNGGKMTNFPLVPPNQSVIVAWFDATGTPKDVFSFGDSGALEAWTVASLPDGSVVVGASFDEATKIGSQSIAPGGNVANAFLSRIRRDGTVVWVRPITGTNKVHLFDLETDEQGHIFAVGEGTGDVHFGSGTFSPANATTVNGWALVLDQDGAVLTYGMFDGPGQVRCRGVDVRGGRFAIIGHTTSRFDHPGGKETTTPSGVDVFTTVYDY